MPETKAEAIAAEKEATDERIEQLRSEAEKLERYSEWLGRGVEIAAELNGDEPAQLTASPKPAARPKRAAPPVRHTGTRRKQADNSEVVKRLEAILAYLRGHGPSKPAEIREALGYGHDGAGKARLKYDLARLSRRGAVEANGVTQSRTYTAKGGSITPATGPKTGVERELYEALADAEGTAAMLSHRLSRNQTETTTVLEGMVRRGVLTRRADEHGAWYSHA